MRWNDLSETLHTIGTFNYTEYVALWEELLQYATCHIYSTENLLCRQVVQWVYWILWAYIWQTKINDLRLCNSSYLRNISSLNGKSQHGSTAMNHRSHLQFAGGFKKGERMKLNGSSAGTAGMIRSMVVWLFETSCKLEISSSSVLQNKLEAAQMMHRY